MRDEPLSERIARLRDEVRTRGGSWARGVPDCAVDVALWRAARPGRSRGERRAAFLHELVRLVPVDIGAEWRLAGEHLRPRHPRGIGTLSPEELELACETFGLSPDEATRVRRCAAVWNVEQDLVEGGWAYVDVGSCTPQSERGRGRPFSDDGRSGVFWSGGWVENHSVRDYAKILRVGFGGVRAEVEALLAGADLADADFPRREHAWRAALSVCDAGMLLGRRYAERAAERVDDAVGARERERLGLIAETCRRVPAEGARTFHEAVQCLWLCHVLTCGEDGINANSIGRLDQILWPWYEADLAAGRLTREDARELMEEFACKLYLEYDVQAIVLGGVDRSGDSAVNELSHVILEATRNVGFIRDVSIRVDRRTPRAFTDLAASLIARGGGIPFVFNDECFIPALAERGIALEDARDYAPIGCIELTIPGKANPHAVSGWFSAAKCLELALFDGVDPRSGERLGPATGSLTDHATFEALFAAYRTQVEFFARRMVYHCNRGELMQRERGPLPCWSVMTDACIERGRDITDGGALYTYHSVCLLGTANTADSLAALRRLVYREGSVAPDDLLAALRADFQGHEQLRRLLLEEAPKYGNDVSEVDDLAREVAEHFIEVMDAFRSPQGGRYFVHLFSFLCNLHFGAGLGATPDGRRAGEPIAYSLSAQQGRDERGVTAMLNSLARLPHRRAAGASAAIVELDPSLVRGEEGAQRIAALTRAAVAMGVGQLQWNVTSAERLRQAQSDPERYGNIPVRVAGFSQMFRLVPPDLQEHIIARTKHAE